ncbi:hypothetical protein SDC9_103233 [bioreactor metagenome]|uniref:Helix-turn-helix domain-containing protein n=1 Tax=bioreactor metagenome TaxID=1076179 RepID=A0A645ATI2_9ZZZZ
MIARVEHAVLLTGREIEAVGYAIKLAQRVRARNGLPVSRDLAALAAALAATGQSDSPGQPEDDTDFIAVSAAADLLGASERTARRLAPRLGGRKIGGRWLVDRQAVAEHAAGQARMEET